ncbi:hypothetical protein [Pedosphaera parvula]|nr:hypothetical protein [Pedosphaera parvula]
MFITTVKKGLYSVRWAVLSAFVLGLVGCQKEEIKVYTAPKDVAAPAAMAAQEPELSPHEHRAVPQVTYTLPKGWKVTGPGRMSVVDFDIVGDDGKQAGVSVTQLGNLQGKDALLVNMFRVNLGMKELSDEEAAKELKPVSLGTETGKLFEISGKRDAESASGTNSQSQVVSVVTVFVHHPDGTWFYRLAGDPTLVEQQKPVFLEFLKSVQIKETKETPATEPEKVAGNFNWNVPKSWKTEAAGQMQVARFAVSGKDNSKAEVFVSVFPSDTGGALANVNRWRRQLGLEETDENQLAKLVSPLDESNPQSILVDMTNQGRRMIGAIMPRNGQYWFYKLLGDAEVVSSEKENFVAFAKSNP